MTRSLKAYYLLQASYWCQQTILLALKIEKPRKDFNELIAHVGYPRDVAVLTRSTL
jgi:acyl-CoA-dependent ceramide synthase